MKSLAFPVRVMLLTMAFAPFALSQNRETTLKQLNTELSLLRLSLDSLRTGLTSEPYSNDAIENLEERLERRFMELERKIHSISSSTSQIVFNPRTTAFINMAGRADSRTVLDAEETAEINNRAFLRSLELDFRAPVDPYAEAVAIVAVENEAGGGFAAHPEEVYGLIKRLPILESAPWGLKLKVGKFRAPFGVNNKLHLHDLPWITRPLIISGFLGTEHGDFFESGFGPTGADFDFFVPNPFDGVTLEMNLSVVNGGEFGLPGSRSSQPGFLAHLNISRDWHNEHLLTGGLSGYAEGRNSLPALVGVDLTYKWSPPERRMTSSLVLGGEAFFGSFSVSDSLGTVGHHPAGWYAYVQYQLSYSLYLGVRYDWLQEPLDPGTETRSIGMYASYYTTEFFRLRFGVERRTNSLPASEALATALFELNFVFGSHPTEPYWVNR